MNRLVVWTIIMLACLFSTIILVNPIRAEASSDTIYVDVSNAGDPLENGSAAHPFDSIQKGVDAAVSGDTIQVAAGVYYKSVEITKSSISLVGEEGSTIVDGNGTEPVGIRLFNAPPTYTDSVSISGFTVRNCIRGITLSRSKNIRLRNVSMIGNTYNFGDFTLQPHDIDTSNTVDGKPIYFWVNEADRQVPADAGFVDLVNSTNITVRGLDLTKNVQGLVLKNTTNSLVENVRIHSNSDGMYLDRWSNNNTIIDSSISNNQFMGIYVSTSSSNTISNNSILNNGYGLLLDSSVYDVTEGGIPGDINIVRHNIISGNDISGSSLHSVYLLNCEDNTFFHNNFVNNTRQVYTENSTSEWDDGAEGNYWADYAGKDLDKDGFGDTPYTIDSDNQDNHPLMGLFTDFAATWQETTYHINAISDSTLSGFQFSQPDKTISFRVNNPDNRSGFCRVSMPLTLLGGPYTLALDGLPSVNFSERSNGTHSFLYFAYDAVHNVEIVGTSVVPEFPPISLVFLLAALTAGAVAVALARRRFVPARSG